MPAISVPTSALVATTEGWRLASERGIGNCVIGADREGLWASRECRATACLGAKPIFVGSKTFFGWCGEENVLFTSRGGVRIGRLLLEGKAFKVKVECHSRLGRCQPGFVDKSILCQQVCEVGTDLDDGVRVRTRNRESPVFIVRRRAFETSFQGNWKAAVVST